MDWQPVRGGGGGGEVATLLDMNRYKLLSFRPLARVRLYLSKVLSVSLWKGYR